jgi:hypothetical protein
MMNAHSLTKTYIRIHFGFLGSYIVQDNNLIRRFG